MRTPRHKMFVVRVRDLRVIEYFVEAISPEHARELVEAAPQADDEFPRTLVESEYGIQEIFLRKKKRGG